MWPWSKHRETGGETARVQAEEHLTQALQAWPEVRRVSNSLRLLRERNDFGEQISLIYRGGDR